MDSISRIHAMRLQHLGIILTLSIAVCGCLEPHPGRQSNKTKPEPADTPSEPYSKPKQVRPWKDIFATTAEYDHGSMFDRGSWVGLEPREFMHPSEFSMAFWLYDGEPVVVDMSYVIWGFEEPQTYDVLAFVNFEPVPFALVEATSSEELLSDEEAASLQTFSDVNTVSLVPGKAHGFTLVLPSSSFPEKAAYDVRILPIWRGSPEPEQKRVRDETSLGAAFVVYNEGTEFKHSVPTLDAEYMLIDLGVREVMHQGLLAALPDDVYDLDDVRTSPEPIRYGQQFEVAPGPLEMTGYLVGIDSGFTTGPVVVVAFDGAQMLVQPFGTLEARHIPNETPTSAYVDGSLGPRFAKFPLTVDVKGEHVVRIIKFPHPFTRFDRAERDYLTAKRIFRSPLVFVRAESFQD